MSDQDFILAPSMVTTHFTLAPVRNILNSLEMILLAESHSGIGEWVVDTYASLSPERRRSLELALKFLPHDDEEFHLDSFPAYMDKVAAYDPYMIRDDIANRFSKKLEMDADTLVANRDAFLHAVETKFGPHYVEKGLKLDMDLYGDMHTLLSNPPTISEMLNEHLRYMWENFVEVEWQRNLPSLQESINAFQSIDFSGQVALDVMRTVTGRDLSEWCCDDVEVATKLVFIPNMHIGPYVTIHSMDDEIVITFGARMPRSVEAATSNTLTRADLLVRLNALADDTRLTILELLSRHQELCAQDIMGILGLSQSSTSRHLRQLTATGYLVERRREVAKCYTLNMERLDDTTLALKKFLRGGKS